MKFEPYHTIQMSLQKTTILFITVGDVLHGGSLGKQSPYCVSIVYAWRMIGKHLNKRIQFQKF